MSAKRTASLPHQFDETASTWRRGHRSRGGDLISPYTVNDTTEQMRQLIGRCKLWACISTMSLNGGGISSPSRKSECASWSAMRVTGLRRLRGTTMRRSLRSLAPRACG